MNGHKPIALGGVLFDTEARQVVDSFEERIADLSGCTEWVSKNVVPAIQSITQLHDTSVELLASFARWYMQHKEDAVVIAHIPHPVEAALFLEMGRLDLIGEWDQPYPLIDVGAMLLTKGNNPLSADDYRATYCEPMLPNTEIGAHHPLYDAYQALSVYLDISPMIRPVKKSDAFNRLNDTLIRINETFKQYNEMIAQEFEDDTEDEGEEEVELDGNGDEIVTEEYEPDFDDGDDDFQARHFHPHDDFNYRPFGAGDLL